MDALSISGIRQPTQAARLVVLASEIAAAHQAATLAAVSALDHARAAGERLTEAKAALTHGEWLPWLEQHCHVSAQQAQRYMRVCREWPAIEAARDASLGTYLPVKKALALVARRSNGPAPTPAPAPDLAAGGNDEPGPAPKPIDTADQPRPVHLMLTERQHRAFKEQLAVLAKHFKTATTTETVLAAVAFAQEAIR